MMLPHLATRLYNTPLLIQRAKLEVILAVLGERIGWPGAQTEMPLPPARSEPPGQPGVALIPVYGSLVRRSLGVDAASGLTSYGEIAAQIDGALVDPRIAGILLDIDSPGGESGGVFELGERIRAANAVKPVWAIASDAAFSAAYALACGASRLVVSRTGGVGSIGVIALHVDQSLRDAQDGYRFTAIFAGERKNDYSPHAPLTDAAAARLQTEVDRLYGLFVTHVAGMRGLGEDQVRATEAAVYFGPEAFQCGLADAEGSLESTLLELGDFLNADRAQRPSGPLATSAMYEPHLEIPQMNAPDSTESSERDPVTDDQPVDRPEVTDPPPQSSETYHPSDEQKVQAAIAQTRADALAIAELCQLAGQSPRIAGFLADGLNPEQVRQRLLALRADSPDISSSFHPDAQAQRTAPEQGPLMQAVRRLIGA